jgi:O-antigen/teichoic acid export membrane protein
MHAIVRKLSGPSAVLLGTTAGTNVLRILNTILLTRMLEPRDFGLVGITLSFFFVVGMLTDVGFQAFIVRHERGDEPEFLDAIWTVHFSRGVLLTAIVAALAWPLAHILGKAALAPIIAVASLTFLLNGAASLSLISAIRTGMVRRLSIIDFLTFVVQMAVGLIAAFFIRNAWAIIISMLVSAVFRTAISYSYFPRARRRFRADPVLREELWKFSRLIAASSILTLIIMQVDKLVLARLFSLPEFGVYAVASNLAAAPLALVGLYTSRIVYPAIASSWREAPSTIRDVIYRRRTIIFYVYTCAGGCLIGGAPLVVRLLYDIRYQGAVIYLQLLAISTALAMFTRSNSESLVAIGHTKMTLIMNIVRIVWLAAAGLIGFVLFGPLGLVAILGMIEIPAYAYGLFAMGRLNLLKIRSELVGLAILGLGVAIGWSVALTGLHFLPVR